jgi:hypothetical protein
MEYEEGDGIRLAFSNKIRHIVQKERVDMAKINGVELKGFKTFRGHDGNGWEANVYLDNKKVGYVVEDGWGGGLQIELSEGDTKITEIRSAAFYKENPSQFETLDMFFDKLSCLLDLEKIFKKKNKDAKCWILQVEFP